MQKERPIIYKDRNEAPESAKIIDAYHSALEELFFIENPHIRKGSSQAEQPLKEFITNSKIEGVWIYYPWRDLLVYTLPEELYFKLRTARNRNIITEQEQGLYRNIAVGVAGLSVGSAVLSSLVVSGGPKTIKIADFDVVEVSNLNRIRAKLPDVGASKCLVAGREVWELDPFADVHLWDKGVSIDTLEEFIIGTPKLDVFIDEMDNIEMKTAARFICKQARIPLLMATDNGDGVIVDVERFDLEQEQVPFHGLIGDRKPDDVKNLPPNEWIELVEKIIGKEHMPERHKESLTEIGKTLSGVPQLGTDALTAGAIISLAVRKIANKEPLSSGKYVFDAGSVLRKSVL